MFDTQDCVEVELSEDTEAKADKKTRLGKRALNNARENHDEAGIEMQVRNNHETKTTLEADLPRVNEIMYAPVVRT